MISIRIRQLDQASPVEIDAIVVSKIGILAGVHTGCLKPDLPLIVIHAIDETDQPVSLGDLILDSSGATVVEIQMFPTVPLGSPDYFFAVVHVMSIFFTAGESGRHVRVVDERGALLVD